MRRPRSPKQLALAVLAVAIAVAWLIFIAGLVLGLIP